MRQSRPWIRKKGKTMNKMEKIARCVKLFAILLSMLFCGCKSEHLELKHSEHLQPGMNIVCDVQDVVIIVDTPDVYNGNALGKLLGECLSKCSGGRMKPRCAPSSENVPLGVSFVKVSFRPDYSGGPGLNYGVGFGLAGALAGEMMRNREDYAVRYVGTIESSLDGKSSTREEFDLRTTFTYEAGTVEDKEIVEEGRNKFNQMTFSQRYLINKNKAEGEIIAPIIEAHLRRKYYPLFAEHLAAIILNYSNACRSNAGAGFRIGGPLPTCKGVRELCGKDRQVLRRDDNAWKYHCRDKRL